MKTVVCHSYNRNIAQKDRDLEAMDKVAGRTGQLKAVIATDTTCSNHMKGMSGITVINCSFDISSDILSGNLLPLPLFLSRLSQ